MSSSGTFSTNVTISSPLPPESHLRGWKPTQPCSALLCGDLPSSVRPPDVFRRNCAEHPDVARPVRSWAKLRFNSLCRTVDQMLPQRGRLLVGAIAASFLGWITAYVALGMQSVIDGVAVSIGGSSFIDVPVAALLILLTIANSLSRRVRGEFRRYVTEVATVWGTFGVAWAITSGGMTSDLTSVVVLAVAVATAWGWFVVRRKDEHGELIRPIGARAALPMSLGVDHRDEDPMKRERARGMVPLLAYGLSARNAYQ